VGRTLTLNGLTMAVFGWVEHKYCSEGVFPAIVPEEIKKGGEKE